VALTRQDSVLTALHVKEKNGAGGRLELLNNQLDLINSPWVRAKETRYCWQQQIQMMH